MRFKLGHLTVPQKLILILQQNNVHTQQNEKILFQGPDR